jgi:hypothetical protein
MGKVIGIEQSHALLAIFAQNVDWSAIEAQTAQAIILDPKSAGANFTKFLQQGARVLNGTGKLTVDYSVKPSLINLAVESHVDRSDIAEVDISKLTRVQMLRDGESSISGHDYLKRLKESGVPMLDVRVMEELLKPENQHLIPEDWKKGLTYFFGTIFRNSVGDLCAPFLDWFGGEWHWSYHWLDYGWGGDGFGASLA